MKTILAIDDSRTILQMIQLTLVAKGFCVLQAFNGQEGLDILREKDIDLVITDINMPVMNGISFITEAQKFNLGVPIIVLSTEMGEDLKKSALTKGAVGWFVKPFKPEPLLEMVVDIMD
ncbi:MAG: response regulator [Leptospiraceae bacterium]|nr:response regulator [Leptospiraceae bacterium]MCP5513198.1 response regulator [Leptospiraceae bacterium]